LNWPIIGGAASTVPDQEIQFARMNYFLMI